MNACRLLCCVGLVTFCCAGVASADLVTWNTTDGDWNTATNWNPQQVPNPNGADDAVIGNGSTVTYPATSLGDLTLDGDRSVTISSGSTWRQTTTHWTRINTGTLAIDGGTFDRTAGGNVVMAFNSDEAAAMTLTNGAAFDVGGELWLGHTGGTTNQTATVNVDGSTIDATALWYWDTDAAGNQFNIDFTGTDPASITVDWLGRRNSGGTANNVTWDMMWNEGLLTAGGLGAADGLYSGQFFTASGAAGPSNGDYVLEYLKAPVTWNAGDGDWNAAANWDPQQVPNLNGGVNAVIDNGATVTYPATALGDLTIDGGRILTIAGGSTWQQTTTHWTRVNTGMLALDGGTFQRTAGGNFVLAFDSNESPTLSLSSGAVLDIAGEIWLGHTAARENQVINVSVDGSAIDTTALWLWDTDAPGNQFNIDFTGTDLASITVDWLGRRDSVSGSQNNVTWKTMWNEGLLTVGGQGAADGLNYGEFFTTSGNAGPSNGDYVLEYLKAPVTWNAGDGDWNTAANWDPQQVPNLNGGVNALIDNGATVTYPASSLGDLTIDGDRILTISGGSTWQQTTTHWTRVNTGVLALDGGTFQRTAGGNVVLAFDSNETATLSLTDGAVFDVAGELWLGHTAARENQVINVNIDDSTLTTGAAIWLWDTDATGNDFNINFTGKDHATVTTDWLGRRDTVHGGQNNVLWESLWDEGLLTVGGEGAAEGLVFAEFFQTSGNPGPYNGAYTLEFTGIPVPEPSTIALAVLGLVGLIGFGRRRR